MVEIRTTKTQKAEVQRVVALLSAPLEKTKVLDCLMILESDSKKQIWIPIDMKLKVLIV